MNNKETNTLAILLSTYNGEKYLKEFLYSIINQTYKYFKLYISDDGSTDRTIEIIQEIVQQDSRIVLFNKNNTNIGIYQNFMKLLEEIDADFYMFADQDDFWLPEKVEKELTAALNFPKKEPILVHCDLEITDENLVTIHKSFWNFYKMKEDNFSSFKYHCAYNGIPGCTILINRTARDLCFPASKTAKLHDAWITLVVSYYKGHFINIKTPLIKYRQHSNNTIGAKKSRTFYQKLINISIITKENIKLYKTIRSLKKISIIAFFINKTIVYLKIILNR